MLGGDPQAAHATLEGLPQQELWSAYFHLHEKNYSYILDTDEESLPEGLLQVCHFMCGQFERAGPSGKLLIAILYENYSEVVALIEEAVVLGVSVGCL